MEKTNHEPLTGMGGLANSGATGLAPGHSQAQSGNSITAPDTDGAVGLFSSLALDGSGGLVVSYDDDTNANLKILNYAPQQAIPDLQSDIKSLVDYGTLKTGQANGLTKPLDNAIRSLDKGCTDDACNQLDDFIADVNERTPTPLDAATAAVLISSEEEIQTAISCT